VKYSFGRKGKEISSDRIKSKMDFDQVARSADGFKPEKISLNGLNSAWYISGGPKLAMVASLVVLLSIGGPFLVRSEFNLFESWSFIEPDASFEITIDTASIAPIVVVTQEDLIDYDPSRAIRIDNTTLASGTTELEALREEAVKSEDVLVRAYPLPDLPTFLASIDQELVYPKETRADSIEGYVKIFFKVNKEGKPENFKIVNSLGEQFDQEAIRVLANHDKWEPATFNGQAVDSYFTIKVLFEIQ